MQSQNQIPPGFCPPTQSYPVPQQQKSSLEDTLKAFMQITGQSIAEIKNSTNMNTQAIAKLENQMG